MSSPLVLAETGHPAVPNDVVQIDVEVDVSRCKPPPGPVVDALQVIQAQGLRVTISQIIAYAGRHFENSYADFWGIGDQRAPIQRAWESLSFARPACALRAKDGRQKLVVDEIVNTREKARVSELLAVGVGLIAARRVYSVPFRFWHPTTANASTDFTAPGPTGPIRLEVRGRFERKNWGSAKNEIYAKFGERPDIRHQLGAIFAPRTNARSRSADLLLVDPQGPVEAPDGNALGRALLLHYAAFFSAQGFWKFADELRRIAAVSAPVFVEYLASGSETLRSLFSSGQAGSRTFEIDGHRFVGTVWPEDVVPIGDAGIGKQWRARGAFLHWGVWLPVVESLAAGDLDALAGARMDSWSGAQDGGWHAVVEDGTCFAASVTPLDSWRE